MVAWRYEEPHCFRCGCNLPFSKISVCVSTIEGDMLVQDLPNPPLEESLHENPSVTVQYDLVLSMALELLRKRR